MKEMELTEMKETFGGFVFLPYLIGALVGAALTQDIDSLVDSFNEGWQDAR